MRKRTIKRFINKKRKLLGTLALGILFVTGYTASFAAAYIASDPYIPDNVPQYLYLSLPNDIPSVSESESQIPTQVIPTQVKEIPIVNLTKTDTSTGFDIRDELFVTGYDTVTLFDKKSCTSHSLPLEDYVIGCVLAEMPSSYHDSALMAQAVACRTYAIYKMINGTSHKDGSQLCTDPGHCQAFANKSEVSPERYEKVRDAVSSTSGIIMFHDSTPILAVFHSSSGKRTASSKEIWGGEREYLSSVETGEVYNSEMSVFKDYYFTRDEFASKLSRLIPELSGYDADEILSSISITRTDSGRAESISVLGYTLSASEFVSYFSLRTKDFIIYHDENGVCITCYGYGHGVGLSQHGAEDMAQKGASADEILTHYYTGISFGKVR